MTTILMAAKPKAAAILEDALEGRATTEIATTMAEVSRAVTRHFDAMIVGVHFDDYRMFDFIRFVKSLPNLRDAPIICVRVVPSQLQPGVLMDVLPISCKAIGASAYLDWYEIERSVGPERIRDEFSRRLQEALPL
jgi:hypothetical protein